VLDRTGSSGIGNKRRMEVLRCSKEVCKNLWEGGSKARFCKVMDRSGAKKIVKDRNTTAGAPR